MLWENGYHTTHSYFTQHLHDNLASTVMRPSLDSNQQSRDCHMTFLRELTSLFSSCHCALSVSFSTIHTYTRVHTHSHSHLHTHSHSHTHSTPSSILSFHHQVVPLLVDNNDLTEGVIQALGQGRRGEGRKREWWKERAGEGERRGKERDGWRGRRAGSG